MIGDAVEYIRERRDRHWLIAGKGPSLDRVRRDAAWCVLALNDACVLVSPEMAHFTDLEAFERCAPVIRTELPDCRVCLPWHPHRRNFPSRDALSQWCLRVPTLAQLLRDGRLLSYNSTTAAKLLPNPRLSTITVRYFSGVAAVNLLLTAGCDPVYSVGLDGGTGYASGLDPAPHLSNGRNSFDAQGPEIVRACRAAGVDHVKPWG